MSAAVRQQINLYQPIFSEGRQSLSSRVVAVAFAVVIVSLTAYSIHASSEMKALRASVEDLRVRQAEQQERLMSSGEEGESQPKLAEAEARVRLLERSLRARRRALEVLQSGAAGQPLGFGARLEALARRHVDGLWLDRLVLSGTNGSMSLSGATLDADTVPSYLQNLARESVLQGTRFDEFVIEQPTRAADEDITSAGDLGAKRRDASPQHIRFRAGSRTLTAAPSVTELIQ